LAGACPDCVRQSGTVLPGAFRKSLASEFEAYIERESQRIPIQDTLRVDPHCHDCNSDKPDELWGRIPGLPETWLKTKDRVKCLRKNGSDVVTITNNNARSCWQLIDQGLAVTVGAEFTCHFPEIGLFCHVLAYGFDREPEVALDAKRQNIDDFLRFAAARNFTLRLRDKERALTPSDGRVVNVANHPIGSLDGLALLHLVRQIGPDVNVVANEFSVP
jgi:hypothetical protein